MTEEATPEDYDLLATTLQAYFDQAVEDIFRSNLVFQGWVEKWDLPPVTPKQRRRNKRRAIIRRAISWRLKVINLEDNWHKGEDCY